MRMQLGWTKKTMALLLVAGLTVIGAAELKLRTRLAGAAIQRLEPSGQAQYRDRGTRKSFNAEVEDVNLPEGTKVTVSSIRNGVKSMIGTITISAAPIRGGELELNTQDGEMVPSLAKGDTIVVEGPSGVLLAGAL